MEDKLKKLFELMQFKYQNLWSAHDTIGEVTRSAKYLSYQIFEPKVAKFISFTSDLDPRTPLKNLFVKEKLSNVVAVNFTWIVTTPKVALKYNNLATKTIVIKDDFNSFKFWLWAQEIDLNNSNFLLRPFDLLSFLSWKAISTNYALIFKNPSCDIYATSLKNTNFTIEVYERSFAFNDSFTDELKGTIAYKNFRMNFYAINQQQTDSSEDVLILT